MSETSTPDPTIDLSKARWVRSDVHVAWVLVEDGHHVLDGIASISYEGGWTWVYKNRGRRAENIGYYGLEDGMLAARIWWEEALGRLREMP